MSAAMSRLGLRCPLIDHFALTKRPMVKRAHHVLSSFAFSEIGDKHVDRHRSTDDETDFAHQARSLLRFEFIQYDQQIKVTVRTHLVTCRRAEEDDSYRVHVCHDVANHFGKPLAHGPSVPATILGSGCSAIGHDDSKSRSRTRYAEPVGRFPDTMEERHGAVGDNLVTQSR